METKDHLALGIYLLHRSGDAELYRRRWAFLCGCIEPDCNVLTYLHGVRKSKSISGHNAENTEAVILSCLKRLKASGLHGSRDYFLLGVMLHYSADAFTLPHNQFARMNMAEHVAYERQLHISFREALTHSLKQPCPAVTADPVRSYPEMRKAYRTSGHTPECDSAFILTACVSLLSGCLHYCRAIKGSRSVITLREPLRERL